MRYKDSRARNENSTLKRKIKEIEDGSLEDIILRTNDLESQTASLLSTVNSQATTISNQATTILDLTTRIETLEGA